jgi:hypothetical protein
MRTKVTLLLLFLNVALFFFIFKFERPWRIEEKTKEARRRVLGPETANIQSLKITYGNSAPAVSLVKRTDGWYLTEPFEWPANPFAVNSIIYDLQFLEHETSWPVADLAKNNQSLADYGLDKPSLTVTFATADPSIPKAPLSTVTLQIGDKAKVGNLLYVLSPDGTRVHVVGRSIADSLAQTLDQLRSDKLFSIPVYEVRVFALTTNANLRIRLRRDANRWLFEAPIQARASKSATELAINNLNHLQVKSFLTAPPADSTRTANPTLRISLEGNNRTETLVLYSPVNGAPATTTDTAADTEYYARLEGKIDGGTQMFTVVIPGQVKDILDKAQTKLRERSLLDFDARAVTAVTIAAPNQPEVSLARDIAAAPAPAAPDPVNGVRIPVAAGEAPWQLVRREGSQAPQTQPADSRTVRRVLEKLAQLSVKETVANGDTPASSGFLNDAPTNEDLENWGFNRPERTVTLTLAGSPGAAAQSLKLELGTGAQRGPNVYARLGGSGSVYQVDAEILRELPVLPLVYRDRLLRELPAGAQITHLKLTEVASKAVIFDQAISADTKGDAVQKLLEQLRTLRAKDFISDQFTPTFSVAGEERPWKYQLEATIALVGGTAGAQTSTTLLSVSDRIGGTVQYAGSAEFGAVWQVEQPFLDAMWELTYGKRDPGPPDSVAK